MEGIAEQSGCPKILRRRFQAQPQTNKRLARVANDVTSGKTAFCRQNGISVCQRHVKTHTLHRTELTPTYSLQPKVYRLPHAPPATH
jgi:hypothetical protein